LGIIGRIAGKNNRKFKKHNRLSPIYKGRSKLNEDYDQEEERFQNGESHSAKKMNSFSTAEAIM